MNNDSDVGVCVASSSYLMCASRGTIYLEDIVYNNEYMLDIANKDKEKLHKQLDKIGYAG